MIEELSLKEELSGYRDNIFECIDEISSTISNSFDFFSGPWNNSLNEKYQDILKCIPEIIKEINTIVDNDSI
jgi:hypothetical protein